MSLKARVIDEKRFRRWARRLERAADTLAQAGAKAAGHLLARRFNKEDLRALAEELKRRSKTATHERLFWEAAELVETKGYSWAKAAREIGRKTGRADAVREVRRGKSESLDRLNSDLRFWYARWFESEEESHRKGEGKKAE